MKTFKAALLAALCVICVQASQTARAADIPTLSWRINADNTAAYTINLIRGESVVLEPEFYQGRDPLPVSGVYETILRYRDDSLPEDAFYTVHGQVLDAATGRLRFEWASTNEAAASIYTYTIAAKSAAGILLRGFGVMRIIGSVGGSETNLPPRIVTVLDWADFDNINIGSAPFVGEDDLLAINQHIEQQIIRDSDQDVQILRALDSATMGGDATGPSTNMVVTGIQHIPVSSLFPSAAADGYGLTYDHARGELLLSPVAATGTTISNIVIISGSNVPTAVAVDEIGLYRTMRPGNIPSAVIDVGGFGIAWFDLLGITLRAGGLNLLNDWITVNTKSYDGTTAAPSRTYAAQSDLGSYRKSNGSEYVEAYATGNEDIWQWGPSGIHLNPGKTINYAESDPLAIQHSTTYTAWTNPGGTYPTNGLVAQSPLLTNGVQSVRYGQSGIMSVLAEISTDSVSWSPLVPTSAAVYVRLSLSLIVPAPMDPTTTISNIIITSWTRPDLFDQTRDSAGQILTVDIAQDARQPVPLSQMQAALTAVSPADWASHTATSDVRLNGHTLMLGNGWTLQDYSGLGLVNTSTSSVFTIANDGGPVITATSGYAGLHVSNFSVTGGVASASLSTNATSIPLLRWSPTLMPAEWQILSTVSESWPATSNGLYQISSTLPAGSTGFVSAVYASGAARIDTYAPLYVQGKLVFTGLQLSGTNLLFIANGVTNRINMEVF